MGMPLLGAEESGSQHSIPEIACQKGNRRYSANVCKVLGFGDETAGKPVVIRRTTSHRRMDQVRRSSWQARVQEDVIGACLRAVRTRSRLRMVLALTLILGGLALAGMPIVSDAGPRQPASGEANAARPFLYRWSLQAEGSARVERSDDGGSTWHGVAAVPERVAEVTAVRGFESRAYARGEDAIWISEDGGESWSRSAELPSRPLALAVTSEKADSVFVGTESMGLLRSNDRGASWQPVDSADFSRNHVGALAVTALAINPDDEQVVYAATATWLGTSTARLTPLGISVSTDGGREWFSLASMPLGAPAITSLRTVAGAPATVVAPDAEGLHTYRAALSDELLVALEDTRPVRRTAAARLVAMTGDRAATQELLRRITDTDPIAGQQIVEAAARLDSNAVAEPLRSLLASDDEMLQARAAYGLGLIGDAGSVEPLAKVLEDGNPMTARYAAEALAAIRSPEAIEALIGPLTMDNGSAARHATLVGLEQAGRPAIGPLAAALSGDDPRLRAGAAEALGWLRPVEATAALSQALSDPDRGVRIQAAWALGELATDDARGALSLAASSSDDEATRAAAESAIARTAGTSTSGASTNLLGRLAETPVLRWTLIALALLLAGALLIIRPEAQLRPHGG